MALGKGAKFYIGAGTSLTTATFTKADAIANLTSIGEQTTTTDEIEVTTLDSEGFKEFEPTLKDNGSFTISGIADSTNYSEIKGKEGEKLPFAISHPSLSALNGKFMGWLSEVTRGEMTPADNVTFSATVRISGEIAAFTIPTT